MDLLLDGASNDLVIENGDIVLTRLRSQSVRQRIAITINTWLGEWILNTDFGTPYRQSILTKIRNKAEVDTIFINQILAVPGVDSITEFESEWDRARRIYTIASLVISTTEGEFDIVSLNNPDNVDYQVPDDQFSIVCDIPSDIPPAPDSTAVVGLAIVGVAIVGVGLFSPANNVPITNSGAESGNTTGWVNEIGELAVSSSNPPPRLGDFSFTGNSSEEVKAYQRFNLSSFSGNRFINLAWDQYTSNSFDTANVYVRFISSDGMTVISEDDSGRRTNAVQSQWENRVSRHPIPNGATYFDIVIDGYLTSKEPPQRVVTSFGVDNIIATATVTDQISGISPRSERTFAIFDGTSKYASIPPMTSPGGDFELTGEFYTGADENVVLSGPNFRLSTSSSGQELRINSRSEMVFTSPTAIQVQQLNRFILRRVNGVATIRINNNTEIDCSSAIPSVLTINALGRDASGIEDDDYLAGTIADVQFVSGFSAQVSPYVSEGDAFGFFIPFNTDGGLRVRFGYERLSDFSSKPIFGGNPSTGANSLTVGILGDFFVVRNNGVTNNFDISNIPEISGSTTEYAGVSVEVEAIPGQIPRLFINREEIQVSVSGGPILSFDPQITMWLFRHTDTLPGEACTDVVTHLEVITVGSGERRYYPNIDDRDGFIINYDPVTRTASTGRSGLLAIAGTFPGGDVNNLIRLSIPNTTGEYVGNISRNPFYRLDEQGTSVTAEGSFVDGLNGLYLNFEVDNSDKRPYTSNDTGTTWVQNSGISPTPIVRAYL